MANITSDNVSVLLNNGDGTFAADVPCGVGDGPRSVGMDDLDGDSDVGAAALAIPLGNWSCRRRFKSVVARLVHFY